jgi:hypothetical protein
MLLIYSSQCQFTVLEETAGGVFVTI